jgi:hypothetical protein
MMLLVDAYSPRPVTALEPLHHDGWRLKVYGIAYRRDRPHPQLAAAARQLACASLPTPAV